MSCSSLLFVQQVLPKELNLPPGAAGRVLRLDHQFRLFRHIGLRSTGWSILLLVIACHCGSDCFIGMRLLSMASADCANKRVPAMPLTLVHCIDSNRSAHLRVHSIPQVLQAAQIRREAGRLPRELHNKAGV